MREAQGGKREGEREVMTEKRREEKIIRGYGDNRKLKNRKKIGRERKRRPNEGMKGRE